MHVLLLYSSLILSGRGYSLVGRASVIVTILIYACTPAATSHVFIKISVFMPKFSSSGELSAVNLNFGTGVSLNMSRIWNGVCWVRNIHIYGELHSKT